MICGMAAVNAQTFAAADSLIYSVNEDNISVTVIGHVKGTDATGSLVIPNTVSYNEHNYPVTKIGRYAFRKHTGFHGTLTIGDNVKEIGYGAFCFCDSLSGNLVIPNSVVKIGDYAFVDCDRFTGDLTIPNSVDTIGRLAFEQCDGFNGTLTIGSSVTYIGESAFQACEYFQEAICLAIEPPTLGVYNGHQFTFYRFGCSSLIVPCGSKEAYENSAWLNSEEGFSTIMQDCDYIDETCENLMSVHPNPAKDNIYIELSPDADCQSVELYTLDGRLVETCHGASQQTTINVENLNAGVYILKIKMADGKEFSERIVKE